MVEGVLNWSYIEVDKDTRGRVTDIRMRSIVLNTGSNIDITVPNQRLVENRVINWSMNDKIRKFEIHSVWHMEHLLMRLLR